MPENEHKPGLGAILQPDARDAEYPMSAHLPEVSEEVLPKERIYKHGPILNQGNTSSCVGHAGRSYLDAAPVVNDGGAKAWDIYLAAQKLDQFPDEPSGKGTTAHALAKYLERLGFIRGGYVWASGYDDIRKWILITGPVVLAMRWTQGCFKTNSQAYIQPRSDTRPAGGHCFLVIGALEDGSLVCQNSWGARFGQGGIFYISRTDFGYMASLGYWEAMAAVEVDKDPERLDPPRNERLQRLRSKLRSQTLELAKLRPVFLQSRESFIKSRDSFLINKEKFYTLREQRAQTLKRIKELT